MTTTTVKLHTGAEMPLVGLGTWKSKPGQVEAAVEAALEAGYRHIDCAACYGNEKEVGTAFSKVFGKEGGAIKREDVFVTSKLWNSDHHPDDVEGACKQTLADLGLEYLDLYLVHWPHAFARGLGKFPKREDGSVIYDFDIPLLDTWHAMEKLVEAGLVKAIGLSNYNSEQIKEIVTGAKSVKPAVLQVESHPYFTQDPLIAAARENGLVVTAYSPLGSPDRPWAKPGEPSLLEDPAIAAIGAKYGKTAAHVALRFQVQRGVIVIPKSVTPSRIVANLQIHDFELSEEDMTV
eukprot:UC1_evm2s2005